MAVEALVWDQLVGLNIDQDIFTASPNNTINCVQIAAIGSGTNIGLALSPKGTGYISAQVPDGTAAGGNARGARSVDLQTFRYAATQVASGSSSFVFPSEGSTASGLYSAAGGGNQSRALGTSSFAFGNSCTAEVAATGSVVFGNNCSVANPNSLSIGDRNQTSGGINAQNVLALGALSLPDLENMIAIGCWNQSNARGYCQGFLIPLRVRTTDATPTDLVVGGSQSGAAGNAFPIAQSVIIQGMLHVTGAKSDGSAIAFYSRNFRIANIGGTTTLIREETIGTDDAAGTTLAITADNTNDRLKITVTGIASETWNWGGWISGLRIRHA